MKAIIYARVSTNEQDNERQLAALKQLADKERLEIIEVIEDKQSGKTKHRTGLTKALKLLHKGKANALVVYALDRLARNTKDALDILEEIDDLDCRLIIHNCNIDTNNAIGRAFFTVIAAFAEFERTQIVERVKSGIENARNKGVKLGRPKTDAETLGNIANHLAMGHGILKTAKLFGVGTSVVQNVANELKRGLQPEQIPELLQ